MMMHQPRYTVAQPPYPFKDDDMFSRAQLLALASLPLLATPAMAASKKTAKPAKEEVITQPNWNYDGIQGSQEEWGNLSPDNAKCILGMEQSPIQISFTEVMRLAPLQFDYKLTPATVAFRNWGFEITLKPGNQLTLLKETYELKKILFHTPSEHVIKDEFYIGEAQLIHESPGGKVLAVSVLIKEEGDVMQPGMDRWLMAVPDAMYDEKKIMEGGMSKANPDILPAAASAPPNAGLPLRRMPGFKPVTFNFNPMDLLPEKHSYYVYKGSLTMPPCTEDVQWHVLKEPIRITNMQMQYMVKPMKRNSRTKQPIYGRTVYESQD